jgi:integrase
MEPRDRQDSAILDGGAEAARQALALAGQALALAGVAARAAEYAQASKAANTRRAYASDWAHFAGWCAGQGMEALPAEPATVCLYLAAFGDDLKSSTLRRRLSCINLAHKAAGHPAPTLYPAVKAVWAGIARMHDAAPTRKTPLIVEAMRAVLATLDDSPRGRRDRALLLLGWGGALRRSELVALDRSDVRLERRGLVLRIRRGKTDQHGLGREVALPPGTRPETCPVVAWQLYAELLADRRPPLLRAVDDRGRLSVARLSDRAVARVVKRVAARAGLQGDYSGHSLRSGLATAAAAAGASERAIMAQTGHRSVAIMRQYIRPATLFDDNAAAIAAL